MTTFTELLHGIRRDADGMLHVAIPPTWMQGRTTYGGLTAALCLEAARELVDDLPLRSAQVAFVGPSGGDVSLKPTLLRRGKNTAFVSVDMRHADGFASQCIFAFGKARESALKFQHLPMPDVPTFDEAPSFFREGPRPGFTNNFNMKGVVGDPPISGSEKRSIGLWMRHKEEALRMSATAVLALADAPPPAALSMLKVPAPISSMTWMAEFLTEDITTEDGWFFALHTADTALNGYIGRQTITVFG